MDIRQNRLAAAADTGITTQTQKSQNDSSLLYRMAVRTMLGDLETVKKKPEMIAPPAKSTVAPTLTIISVPLPPAYLVSPVKTSPQPTAPPDPPVKTETAKLVVPIPPAIKPKEETKDELTKTIEAIVAGKTPQKTTEETTIKKETETKTKKETFLKIKEEKQKAKEDQRIAQQTAREEEKIAKELAEKTARELRLVEETEKREAVKKLREEINQNLEKAQIDYEAGAYESVIELAQKILANESASWFLKLKVNQLIRKANRGLHKKQINQMKEATQIKDEENLKEIVASLPSSALSINTQRITASPPPNLPTLPDSSADIENLVAQALPQENSTPGPRAISPLLTELISEASSEPEEESGPNFLDFMKNKRLLFIGASFGLLIILVSIGLWFANKDTGSPVVISPSSTPTVSATPTPSRPAPEPLFAADKQKIITLSEEQGLKESLLALAKTEEPIGTFIALDIKDNNNQLLSLKEIAQNLNLEIFSMPTQDCIQGEDCLGSKTLEDLIDLTKFSLFVYSQNGSSTNPSSPFAPTTGENEGRLGLIISLKKQTTSTSTQSIENQLANSLKDLETLLPKEFASFLLKTSAIPQIPAFSQASYKNAVIRYLNLPTSDITIDYAIFDGKLILATSKESMLSIIDRITTINQAGERL